MAVPEQLQGWHHHRRYGYLLTNQNLRFTNINWTFFIAAGALTVVCLIVYIAVKKRYWFW